MKQSPPILELRKLTKKFGSLTAVNEIDLSIKNGEFFTIVGPSGSGKSTMVRMLAGLDKPTSGEILLRGEVINDVPANKRPTCMVFQSLALFPHMTVGKNIEYSAKCKGKDKTERGTVARRSLGLAHLPVSFYDKMVSQCSGGERQRVALARAMAHEPDILFFDEPLSALDYRLKKSLEKEIKDIQRETGKTFIYITHNLEEAMVMSDRIGVMNQGSLIQVASPEFIYSSPQSKFVTEFMGEVNSIPVVLSNDGYLKSESLQTSFSAPDKMPEGFSSGALIIRPENMNFLDSKSSHSNKIKGNIFNEYLLGSRVQYQVRSQNQTFLVETLSTDPSRPRSGDDVLLGWEANDSLVFAE